METTIRQATPADKDFLITSIIEAEKSGGDVISYCAIFNISEDELRTALGHILDEDMAGQELSVSGFLVAEVDGKPAAALSTWVEKANGMGSSMIKSNLLMYFIDREKILAAAPNLTLMNEVGIQRAEYALQIECVYTAPQYRGKGLSSKLIEEHIKLRQAAGMTFNKVQVILLKNNVSAQKAYAKAGFTIAEEKRCADRAILKLLPSDTKILMQKQLNS